MRLFITHMFLSLLFQSPIVFLLVVLALIVSISIHEFSHAFVAYKLGDPTPKYLGRLSLDPRKHLDPLGTLALIFVGFGWGRPVPFNPINLTNIKRDSGLIAFAGPVSNFLLATVLSIIYRLVGGVGVLGGFLYLAIFYNLILGIFNLLPLHPLDGFKVVYGLLPPKLAVQWGQMERYGIFILLFLILTRSTGQLIFPIVDFAMNMLVP